MFCHGKPGSKADATLLLNVNPDADIVAVDLLANTPEDVDVAFSNALHSKVIASHNRGVVLVGFSIGGMAAIKIAATRPGFVSRLVLISPAARLSMGNFLQGMAGKPVFELAMSHPKLFRLLTVFQGLMTRWSPERTAGAFFRNCGAAERALFEDPAFQASLNQALEECFLRRPDAYLAFINAYVTDWSETIDLVQCPVELWHGTNDTWSPPEMSYPLAKRFGEKATLRMVEHAKHYSTMSQVIL
ncbi:alpha/beta hydrolase [Marivivens sp. LCG002]|uniref:alpha/beta fold hydrolase n=1 Tax=Marivivens sp. LCG002 TaxID=3051171 RepID=UPI00331F677E